MGIRGPGKSRTVRTPIDSHTITLPIYVILKKWFAEVDTVKIMYTASSKSLLVQNEEEILTGYFKSDLEFGNIVENSEKVKIIKRALGPDRIVLDDYQWKILSHDDVVKNSVVVTDTLESIEWIEGVNFEIDNTSGKVRTIKITGKEGTASGAGAGEGSEVVSLPLVIDVQKEIVIHYEYFNTLVKDIDYSFDYVRGSISRKEGGCLVSGSKVLIDYRISELVRDELISLAIDQAHTWIIKKIGCSYEGSSDDNLKYGEAFLALYLLSKTSAANLIYEKRNDDIEEAAKELKLIAQDYYAMALSYLQDYVLIPTSVKGVAIKKNNGLTNSLLQ